MNDDIYRRWRLAMFCVTLVAIATLPAAAAMVIWGVRALALHLIEAL